MSEQESANSSSDQITFKKRSRLANVRKRDIEDDVSSLQSSASISNSASQSADPNCEVNPLNRGTSEEDLTTAIVSASQSNSTRRTPFFVSSAKKPRAQVRTKEARVGSDSEEEPETASQNEISYQSSGVHSTYSRDKAATATNETDTAADLDAQASFERSQALQKQLKEKPDDKVYRGAGGYQQFYEKKDSSIANASSGLVRQGPMRAPTNVRVTVRWDYAPDICKDYKETGYCGFGDSCKFLHDRSDYKHGWQLEREEKLAAAHKSHAHGHSEHDFEVHGEDDEIPFKCVMCRQSYVNPVVTKCQHYFCEKCALERYRHESRRCFVCNADTQGIFKPATEVASKLKGMQEKKLSHDEGVEEEEHSS